MVRARRAAMRHCVRSIKHGAVLKVAYGRGQRRAAKKVAALITFRTAWRHFVSRRRESAFYLDLNLDLELGGIWCLEEGSLPSISGVERSWRRN